MTNDEFNAWVAEHEKQFHPTDGLGINPGDTLYFTDAVPHPAGKEVEFFVPNSNKLLEYVQKHLARPGVTPVANRALDPRGGTWYTERVFLQQWSIQQTNAGWRTTCGWVEAKMRGQRPAFEAPTLAEALVPVRKFRETELAPPGV